MNPRSIPGWLQKVARLVLPLRLRSWLKRLLPPSQAEATSAQLSPASDDQLNPDEVNAFLAQAQRYLASDELYAHLKPVLEGNGVQLLRSSYYSPVPTIEEISKTWEVQPPHLPPYLEPGLYDQNFLLGFLTEVLQPYSSEFDPPVEHAESAPRFYWNNPMFTYSDAMAYYCMVRHFRPKKIIEIGAGYSSLVAAQALEANGSGELILIEPFPGEVLQAVKSARLITVPVQQVPVEFFTESLGDGDILFIDSTHTVKTGGDCLYIYLKILPALTKHTLIHVHDIFLPEMFPAHWQVYQHLYWFEQYLLQAYILDNPSVRVLYGSHYHYRNNLSALEAFMGNKFGPGGGSFWFEKNR